jgi:hypothetical protein
MEHWVREGSDTNEEICFWLIIQNSQVYSIYKNNCVPKFIGY